MYFDKHMSKQKTSISIQLVVPFFWCLIFVAKRNISVPKNSIFFFKKAQFTAPKTIQCRKNQFSVEKNQYTGQKKGI